jgi:hypothetical protein
MHMIGDAAHALGNSIGGANDSTKICVQVTAPSRLDERLMIFRSENNVIMQTQVCRWHMDLIYHAPARALNCVLYPITGGWHHRLIS